MIGGKTVDTIAFVFYILAGVMLFISVCIGIYAKRTLEKARKFFHFAWDLTHEEDTQNRTQQQMPIAQQQAPQRTHTAQYTEPQNTTVESGAA